MAFPGVTPIAIPAGFTVWAASDVHGQLGAVDRLLAQAGLAVDGSWVAPPGTALVITGDVVDRGPDSVELTRRLVALREQAAARGGMVALLEGNHEVQVLGGLAGVPDIFRAFLQFGGGATLLSAGMAMGEWEGMEPAAIEARVDALVPDFLPALRTFAPYATWGDVLLVHGGPVQGMDLADWEAGAERLWIRRAFYEADEPFPDHDAWRAFRDAGMTRVVFGHTPMDRVTFYHGGRAVSLDTWKGGEVTLAGFRPGEALEAGRVLSTAAEPRAITDAPIDAATIRAIDAELPAVVRAWWASLAG
jgi:serine/threonine protein phosphatase 1